MIKRKWLWGLLIGISIATLLDLLLVSFLTTRTFCVEPLSCGDKLNSFLLGLRFFIPAGAIAGLFFGLLFERRFYLALTILIAGGAGLYLVFMRVPTISEISQQVQNSTSSTKDETTNWQTYRNEELRFEVKFPLNWNLDTYEAIDSKSALGAVSICKKGCVVVADQLNLDWDLQIIRSLGGPVGTNPGSNWNPIDIGDGHWYKEINPEAGYLYQAERYAFFVLEKGIDEPLLYQILSTFKFIE